MNRTWKRTLIILIIALALALTVAVPAFMPAGHSGALGTGHGITIADPSVPTSGGGGGG
jgi:hypothetical protein